MMFTLEAVLRRYSLELNVNKTKYIASMDGRITYHDTEIEEYGNINIWENHTAKLSA